MNIMDRTAYIARRTSETEVQVRLTLDGTGEADIQTGLPFMDHMLTLTAAHGLFDISIQAKGDIQVDYHHTLEDVGITLGQALRKALGDFSGIERYGHVTLPMDEALVSIAVDVSNRPFLGYHVPLVAGSYMSFDVQVIKEFFRALVQHGGLTLHIRLLYGENTHHIFESCFKAFGRALKQAVALEPKRRGVPSTKGVL